MPVHKVPGGGFQYGNSGKVYRGKGAAHKAYAQAAAIHHAGYSEPGTGHGARVASMMARDFPGHGRKK